MPTNDDTLDEVFDEDEYLEENDDTKTLDDLPENPTDDRELTRQEARDILQQLDGWELKRTPHRDVFRNPNKSVSLNELKFFHSKALMKAEKVTYRPLETYYDPKEKKLFLDTVSTLTASKIWTKYNVRVDSDGTEGTHYRSYGGLLYKDAMDDLEGFKYSRIKTRKSIRDSKAV